MSVVIAVVMMRMDGTIHVTFFRFIPSIPGDTKGVVDSVTPHLNIQLC